MLFHHNVACFAGRRGFYAATFFQQVASLGNNLAIAIVAGQSMKVSLSCQLLVHLLLLVWSNSRCLIT